MSLSIVMVINRASAELTTGVCLNRLALRICLPGSAFHHYCGADRALNATAVLLPCMHACSYIMHARVGGAESGQCQFQGGSYLRPLGLSSATRRQ